MILGSGGAGRALRLALSMYPDDVATPRSLPRDEPLPTPQNETDLLVLANPHALHTPRLLEAQSLGYRWAISEKPAAVSLEQVASLESLELRTWVCHGYRMLWGPNELRQAVHGGKFGELISVEGRYWQSSATQPGRPPGWKDDPALGGHADVLLDLGTHWADLVTFVLGAQPDTTDVRLWYGNAASPHRDTHVHLRHSFGDTESFGSISKTMHGAGNHLELVVIGTDASARWSFQNPDAIEWGHQGETTTHVRKSAQPPARLAPFHGLGWIEGYARIVGEVMEEIRGRRRAEAPSLGEHLPVLRALLKAAQTTKSL